jgi:hypothetical protein
MENQNSQNFLHNIKKSNYDAKRLIELCTNCYEKIYGKDITSITGINIKIDVAGEFKKLAPGTLVPCDCAHCHLKAIANIDGALKVTYDPKGSKTAVWKDYTFN